MSLSLKRSKIVIKVRNFFNENDIIKELEQTRLIVDVSEEPNLYTQIAGISAGIPQINRTHYGVCRPF